MSLKHKTGFGHIEDTGPTPREQFAPRFGFTVTESNDLVTFDGQPFIKIKRLGGKLPKGFQDRLFQHIADLVTGRKTALWDEQAVYGEFARDRAHSRFNGERRADYAMHVREGNADFDTRGNTAALKTDGTK